jgi:ubiquinol-cytochrome c reductase iron-sulfur subunit
MSDDGVDLGRRHFLTVATSITGGVGVVLAAVPFVLSMKPSVKAKALGAPVEIDITRLEPGQASYVAWRGRAIAVVRRTSDMLATLDQLTPELEDPDSIEAQQPEYAQNQFRSRKSEYLVVESLCTHLGCSPTYRPDVAPEDLGSKWRGGFFCPCHGSRFDLAGRVYKDVPAPLNLVIPPHKYLGEFLILIGDDSEMV